MKYLLKECCYLFDSVELNKFSSNQTSINYLLSLFRSEYETNEIEILHRDKFQHCEFKVLELLENALLAAGLNLKRSLLNRLKPLNRKIKNLHPQEKYLLQIIQFCYSKKNILVIEGLSFVHSMNLALISQIIAGDLKFKDKKILIIDRKEDLWKKDFHKFKEFSLVNQSRLKEVS